MRFRPDKPEEYQTAYMHLTLSNGAAYVVEKYAVMTVVEILHKGPQREDACHSLVQVGNEEPLEVRENYKVIVAVLEAYNKFRLSIGD